LPLTLLVLTGTAFVMTGVELEAAGTELAIAAEEDIRFVLTYMCMCVCVCGCECASKKMLNLELICAFVYFFSILL